MGRSLRAEVKIAVQGKILNPNKEKRHKLNVVLEKYLKAVKFFASFKIKDKNLLQQKAYEEARRRFGVYPWRNFSLLLIFVGTREPQAF